ncbi:hypothetical protein [Silvanigrella aquatica]|uniref:Lipoprotein n=1 Tax=Silvanigrella aquatica TaxID=1915309 RepID=A0A1L4CZT9_9BACT|nr:hypothetical protein [Silvanigrella aquatica]APJ03465.1 hypothetical protein AXG55_05920 [Silvanigrella aquatica]
MSLVTKSLSIAVLSLAIVSCKNSGNSNSKNNDNKEETTLENKGLLGLWAYENQLDDNLDNDKKIAHKINFDFSANKFNEFTKAKATQSIGDKKIVCSIGVKLDGDENKGKIALVADSILEESQGYEDDLAVAHKMCADFETNSKDKYEYTRVSHDTVKMCEILPSSINLSASVYSVDGVTSTESVEVIPAAVDDKLEVITDTKNESHCRIFKIN